MLGKMEDKMAQAVSQGSSRGSAEQLGTLSHRFSTSGKAYWKDSVLCIGENPGRSCLSNNGPKSGVFPYS